MSTTEAVEKTMRSVFVGNIPYEVTEERLKEIFGEVGTVLSFKLVFDRESGKPKGYGFCEYSNQETALSAMRNLNNFEIGGRSLRVDNACTEKSRLEMQSLMQISQGENLFGEFVSPDKAPEAIREVVSSLPPEEMYEILNEMKDSIRNNPEETRRMLLENGQLSYALLQITVAMGIIDRITASQMLYPENNEAALSLEIHPDNLMPGMRKANMIPPKLDLSWKQTPQNEEVIGPQRDMWNRGEQFDNQPLLPIGRQESWNDKPKRVSTNQLQAPPVQDMDMRSVPLGMNQQSMFGDQDFRNPMVPMQPPPGFPSNMVMPNMSRPPPSATQNFHGSRQHSMNVPPPNMQPAPTMQPPPTIGPSRMMPHQPSNNQPSKQMAQMQAAMLPPSAPQQAKQIAQTLAGTDNEKAALIMQVMQLTDEQISKLPAEQRQSILILKEQIAKSTKH